MIDAILSFIAGVYGHILDFINDIVAFVSEGIYDFIVKAFAEFVKWGTLQMLTFKLVPARKVSFSQFAHPIFKRPALASWRNPVGQSGFHVFEDKMPPFPRFSGVSAPGSVAARGFFPPPGGG